MPRLVELIRKGSAPPSMVRRAARGDLALPAAEAIEILVALTADQELGSEAEHTLAGWDEAALCEIASSPDTPLPVLLHLLQLVQQRPAVIAALCGNPSLPPEELEALASRGLPEILQAMTRSERVRRSTQLLERMAENPAADSLRPQLREWIGAAQAGPEAPDDPDVEEFVIGVLARHPEVVREERPFELVLGSENEEDPLARLLENAKRSEAEGSEVQVAPEETEKISILQKIGRMRVGERIKLAILGNREERMILIRDRSKLVSLAVLSSPKVNESEMETFAAMKNIQETVLRAIASNRKNMKNYGVVRTLANNPKTPLDVALPLLAHLLIKDLRSLSINKNINETVRKVALKRYRAKQERRVD